MRAVVVCLGLATVLALPLESASLQTSELAREQYSPLAAEQSRHPHGQPQTWYEHALSRLNPGNVDYGRAMEERRRALLEATVRNGYFNYSLAATALLLLVMAVCTKLVIDLKRRNWLMAEMAADLVSHDERSRQAAREAIRRHNDHMERCNRVVEAQESGRPIPGASSETNELREKLRETADQLDAVSKERNKLKADLDEKTRLVTELSLRMDEVSRKTNGQGASNRRATGAPAPAGEESEAARLMQHINLLQAQLQAQRKENERLRGA